MKQINNFGLMGIKNWYHKLILPICMLLVSCGAGDQSGTILGYNISMADVNGKPISAIYLPTINSHETYQLVFTNPNNFAVSPPLPDPVHGLCDRKWISQTHDSQPAKCGYTNFAAPDQPYPSSCIYSLRSIPPGGSCFYRMEAFWYPVLQSPGTYSYPLEYYISGNGVNHLLVSQNMTNVIGNLANQFVYYQIGSNYEESAPYQLLDHGSPNESGTFHSVVSLDGNWLYSCNWSNGNECDKYQLNYESGIGITIESDNKTKFTLPQLESGWLDMKVDYNGNSAWFLALESGIESTIESYMIVNSNNPGNVYNISVPYKSTNMGKLVTGLDNSTWLATSESQFIYDENSNSFLPTNISESVQAIAADGTVVSNSYCYHSNGSNTNYVAESIAFANIAPDYPYPQLDGYSVKVISSGYGIYRTALDFSMLTQWSSAIKYYKLHTENGLCQLQVDDYITSDITVTRKYAIEPLCPGWDFDQCPVIFPISQVYLGKESDESK